MAIYRFPWAVTENPQVGIVNMGNDIIGGSKSAPLIHHVCTNELGISSRLFTSIPEAEAAFKKNMPRMVILSGGSHSVYNPDAPHLSSSLIERCIIQQRPIFGICFGAQDLVQAFGGRIRQAPQNETGIHELFLNRQQHLFEGYSGGEVVMNHKDKIEKLPTGWTNFGYTKYSRYAFFGDYEKKIFGTLFHPEMSHSQGAEKILSHVAFSLAGCTVDYTFNHEVYAREAVSFIKKCAGKGDLLVLFSGGIDSATAWELACRAVGRQRVKAIFIDTGFMREGEMDAVRQIFGTRTIKYIDAREEFYQAVENIGFIPEHRAEYFATVRKVMGHTFIRVAERAARGWGNITGLVQGTNLADWWETTTGQKDHHNVGGLPEDMNLDVIEPIAGIYKVVVRNVARHLGLPTKVIWRQPFPGPGNALRMYPPITRENAHILARANRILEEVVEKHYRDPQKRPSQYYVSLPSDELCANVGDEREYGNAFNVCAFDAGKRESYASAKAFRFSRGCEEEIARRLTNEIRLPNGKSFVQVFRNMVGKPPATIEPN